MNAAALPSPRPAAQPLGLEHRPLIEGALERSRGPLGERAPSDLTFENLYLFRAAHCYGYVPGAYPFIGGRTYDGVSHLIALFDLTELTPLALAELLQPGEWFYPVPAQIAQRLHSKNFECMALREDSDYLYLASDFVGYHTKPLRGQRAAVRKLKERHVITQQDVRHDGATDAFAVLDRWMAEKELAEDAADCIPCREALRPPQGLNPLAGTIYYADGQPAGFLLSEQLNPHVRVVRFVKGLSAFDGIYPHMFQQLCVGNAGSLRWLNFEQDLGKPNFRKSKLSYGPASLLEKFRVRPRLPGQTGP
jgi:hypothetical protein